MEHDTIYIFVPISDRPLSAPTTTARLWICPGTFFAPIQNLPSREASGLEYVRQKQGTGDQLVRSSEAQAACSRSFVTPHSFRGAIFWKRAAFPANYDLPVSNKAAQCMQHIGSWLSHIFCNFPRRMPSRMALEPFKDFSLSHFYYLACGKLFRQASPRAHTKSSCVPGRIAPYVSFPLSSSTSMSKSSISSAS